jgi:homogentisate 1,2-dioxygenase
MLDRVAFGEIAKKHHIVLRGGDGALRHEECITRRGFDGPYTIAYHVNRPQTQEPAETKRGFARPEAAPPRGLLKRHFRSTELPRHGGAPLDDRLALLFNEDVVISALFPDRSDPVYFVNADADDLFFVFEGRGVLRSILGDVPFEKNDYVCVPKGVMHRFVLPEATTQYWVSIECNHGLKLLNQYRNETGQLRMDAPYSHRDFRRPAFEGPKDEGIRDVVVKREGIFHGFRYAHSPFDVVGWDGSVYPWAFPILNFQPRAGLVHLPPDWHGTFATEGALVCSFVPRVVDFHPDAIPCPYPHSSVDCDEMIFYVSGNFTSRRGVGPGSISYHPMGLAHGPHPGAYEGSIGATRTDELAVMLDTYRPLRPTAHAVSVEDSGYMRSFL